MLFRSSIFPRKSVLVLCGRRNGESVFLTGCSRGLSPSLIKMRVWVVVSICLSSATDSCSVVAVLSYKTPVQPPAKHRILYSPPSTR